MKKLLCLLTSLACDRHITSTATMIEIVCNLASAPDWRMPPIWSCRAGGSLHRCNLLLVLTTDAAMGHWWHQKVPPWHCAWRQATHQCSHDQLKQSFETLGNHGRILILQCQAPELAVISVAGWSVVLNSLDKYSLTPSAYRLVCRAAPWPFTFGN